MNDRGDGARGSPPGIPPEGELSVEQSRRARELLDEVSRLSPAEAESFLESRQGEDPRVLSEVRDLLSPPTIEVTQRTRADLVARTMPTDGAAPSLPEGKVLGRYRIGQRLGGGGMGEVYQAEELEGHRQVALKIINPTVASGVSRERFLREGKLAASVNHPNSVYVFGTEDADGALVIAMELMPGGTLADVVRQRGPLPYTEAVDGTLQMIAGLRAAEAKGVLHRDIKPANCFVDADTNVKIGDYGLSKPTGDVDATAMTHAGTVMGTPSYAPPEQLKGEAVDVRSDIYAVGATLYFLLTGSVPFGGTNAVQVISSVLSDRPRFPADRTKAVPPVLRKLVLRCMAKDPSRRPQSYAELEARLRPFGSAVPQPAPLANRVVAGVIDGILSRVTALSLFLFVAELTIRTQGESLLSESASRYLSALVVILYLGLSEGLFAATPGKAMVGQRVLKTSGRKLNLLQALLRATIFFGPAILVGWFVVKIMWKSNPPSAGGFYLINAVMLLTPLLLFVGASRENGWLGLHDRWTRSRVSARTTARASHRVETPRARTVATPGSELVAGFRIEGRLEGLSQARFEVARDEVLGREVWLSRSVPDGHEAVPRPSGARRSLSRPARLRWLAGSADEGWEAFESVDGSPVTALRARQPWEIVRGWLHAASEEMVADASSANTLSLVTPEQVWVTGDGRLVLVEAELLGLASSTDESWRQAQRNLARAAGHALAPDSQSADGVPAIPLPLPARDLLGRLARAEFRDPAELLSAPELRPTPSGSLGRRRAISIGLQSVAPTGSLIFFTIAFGLAIALPSFIQGELELRKCLTRLGELESPDCKREGDWEAEHRALQIVAANGIRQRAILAVRWARPDDPEKVVRATIRQLPAEQREAATNAFEAYPDPTDQQVEEARAYLAPLLGDVEKSAAKIQEWSIVQWMATMSLLAWIPLMVVGVAALITAPLFRGGLLFKLLGLAVVREDGSRASRWRCLGRAAIAWAVPLAGALFILDVGPWDLLPRKIEAWVALFVVLFMLVGAIGSVLRPSRGLQDRLARTWVVPA